VTPGNLSRVLFEYLVAAVSEFVEQRRTLNKP